MTSLSDDAYVGTLHYKLLDPPISGGGEDLQQTCDNGNSTTTDVNLTAGNLTVAVGAISAGGDITTLGGDIISTGSVEADSDIVSDNGNITATVGNITAPAGFLSVRNDITTSTGDFLAPAGRVIASQFIRSDTGNILTAVGDIYAAGGGKIYTIGGGNMECSGKIISNRAPPLTEALTTLTDIKIGQNATGLSASFSGKVEILDECKVVGQIVQTGAGNNITSAGSLNLTAGDITAYASGGGTGGTLSYARRSIDNIRQFINSNGTGSIVDTVNMNGNDYLTWNINAVGGTVSSAELTITKTDYLGGVSLIGNSILITDAQGTGSTGITVSKQVYGGTGTTTVWKLNFSPSIPSGQSITGSFEIITI